MADARARIVMSLRTYGGLALPGKWGSGAFPPHRPPTILPFPPNHAPAHGPRPLFGSVRSTHLRTVRPLQFRPGSRDRDIEMVYDHTYITTEFEWERPKSHTP